MSISESNSKESNNFKVLVRVRPPLQREVDGSMKKFEPIVSILTLVPNLRRLENNHYSRVSRS